jgi:nicotinate-nucleotide--dimethylbenzimidazole phosphoribosyltransferase
MLIDATIRDIAPADPSWREKATQRIATLAMPPWALGRLLDLAVDLAGMTRSLAPPVARRCVVVMVGDHGVVKEGVSAFPQEVTVQMVRNFVAGSAGINVLANQAGARVLVVDVGVAGCLDDLVAAGQICSRRVAAGTRSIADGPAMTRRQAQQAIEVGIQIAHEIADETDMYATGDMGIGNTAASSAMVAALCGISPEAATGHGTGINGASWRRKAEVVRRALEVNQPAPNDPLDVLSKVGGFEIGALAGLILGAAAQRKPVLIDGFISSTAALLANAFSPVAADYMIAAHRSTEPGQHAALKRLGKTPLFDLGLRLGEGTGAALAMHLVEASVRILTEMATFEAAGVREKIR